MGAIRSAVEKRGGGGWRRASRLFAIALGCTAAFSGARAELVFQVAERVDGKETWSPPRIYADAPQAARAHERVQDVRVSLTGPVMPRDYEGARVLGMLVGSGKHRIADNTVSFSSTGGDIDAALEVGRILRSLGVSTRVESGAQCVSACVFAFMGGERRSVAGALGIHRPHFPFTQDFPGRKAKFRHLQKTLKDYVEEMDFPDSLYEAVMLVPPESMQMLAPADLKRFYLDGISPSSEDAVDAAAARRLELTMADYLKLKARTSLASRLPAAEPLDQAGILPAPIWRSHSDEGVAGFAR